MFIQTQDTPNPATLKFIPGVPVMTQGTADFANSEGSNKSPLARRLFQIDGVSAVFLGGNFVAVTKAETLDWFALKPAILAGIITMLLINFDLKMLLLLWHFQKAFLCQHYRQ